MMEKPKGRLTYTIVKGAGGTMLDVILFIIGIAMAVVTFGFILASIYH